MIRRFVALLIVLLFTGCSSEEPVLVEKNELSNFTSEYDVSAWEVVYESDDYLIDGYVVSPIDQSERYPTLVINRGGNRNFGEIDEEWLAHMHAYWADQGYTVISSQYREGGNSEGVDEFGGNDVNDVLQLEYVAQEIEFADEDEIYMFGLSRGGVMTYRAIQEGMEIRAAATLGGVSDLMETYEARGINMKRVLVDLVGHPAEEPEEYEKRSAMAWPEDISVPLLLLHGEKDEQVPYNQSTDLYEELHERGHEVKLVTYEEGDHGLHDYFEDYNREVLKWFNTYEN
ncbi:alpha/beta hydrolase family protein [Salipaludibacillus daqingensis]|uniref:alpha/beta hydrolase family protein n=1 Tax=Salipaludibacillus daqingensis TaxID=3041001 RepID=UPI002476318F|nr:prolyl oligopeptidase family serine peptidase [Salipaludibacillus daqingensis]